MRYRFLGPDEGLLWGEASDEDWAERAVVAYRAAVARGDGPPLVFAADT